VSTAAESVREHDDQFPAVLNATQARRLLGVGKNTFTRWVSTGFIPDACYLYDDDTSTRWYSRDALLEWAARAES
jgi:hypothetical protein